MNLDIYIYVTCPAEAFVYYALENLCVRVDTHSLPLFLVLARCVLCLRLLAATFTVYEKFKHACAHGTAVCVVWENRCSQNHRGVLVPSGSQYPVSSPVLFGACAWECSITLKLLLPAVDTNQFIKEIKLKLIYKGNERIVCIPNTKVRQRFNVSPSRINISSSSIVATTKRNFQKFLYPCLPSRNFMKRQEIEVSKILQQIVAGPL